MAAALSTDDIGTIAVVVIVAIVVIGFVLGLVMNKAIGRVVLAIIVIGLGVLIWTQRAVAAGPGQQVRHQRDVLRVSRESQQGRAGALRHAQPLAGRPPDRSAVSVGRRPCAARRPRRMWIAVGIRLSTTTAEQDRVDQRLDRVAHHLDVAEPVAEQGHPVRPGDRADDRVDRGSARTASGRRRRARWRPSARPGRSGPR